jgi:CRISPR-associated protein Csb1
MDLKALTTVVAEQAAFRRRQRLQPVGGSGDKIFPPTYLSKDGPIHVFEKRRLNGGDCWTVLLDSVQSSSNRAEEALLEEARAGKITLPYLSVDFSKTEAPEVGEITSLDAPHRIFDAILRDSELDGSPLMRSDVGRQLQLATMANASAILELSPNALLMGAWNSTGEGGGLGAKFPRCMISEIVGVGVAIAGEDENGNALPAGKRTGSRIDPLGILKGVPVYKGAFASDWSSSPGEKGQKKAKPSDINHGNIPPSVDELGVTVDYAEHSFVVGFAALRRLRFGDETRNQIALALLAALGLVAHFAQVRQGYALRSRCNLVCDGMAPLELVRFDGKVEEVDMDLDAAERLYREAVKAAASAGFTLSSEPLHLTPQEKLVYLVKQSRELALAGKGGEAEETSVAGA